MEIQNNRVNVPEWKSISTKGKVPAKLQKLDELGRNIWWVWNNKVTDLFDRIDPETWESCGKNPVLFLEKAPAEKLDAVIADKAMMKEIDDVYSEFRKYMDVKPDDKKPSIAYFSMEYGLTDVIKIYSGGLGVLAGDYLKEASDRNYNMVAVGFLYRYGYFTQSLSVEGNQIANYEPQDFNKLPIEQLKNADGSAMVLEVPFYDRTIFANIWKVSVGRVPLYLMDTDVEGNSEWDRAITHQLYGGDWENRLKQEYMLGIGGIYLLEKLGIKQEVYHCNEGHAALINLQRLANFIKNEGLNFNQALEAVRASSIYTVHTPVPAGHDRFDEGLFGKYMYKYPEMLGISWDDLMDLGRENAGDKGEKFSMSVLACRTCQESNGVSWLHGEVSKKMFAPIWKGYFPDELHVGYVTNGVHMPTWADQKWKDLFERVFAKSFYDNQFDEKIWEAIYSVKDEEIWDIKMSLKKRLINFINTKYRNGWLKNEANPSLIMEILDKVNPNALTIGFGRRFATYKRAHLLFSDLDRLSKIVNNDRCPVQFIFTGKAHPADGAGQGLIRRIVEISRMPQFQGKILFLENYDMALARILISGVDIWLNNPTRPLEASGTSGEKALMNGVVNFSVKDGWWLEGYREGAGWALTEKRTYDNQGLQDQLDAATIYRLLENEIVPTYYNTNSHGYSPEWIQVIKNSFAKIAPNYTTSRMIDDYNNRFYTRLAKQSKLVSANNFAKAKELADWKGKVARIWDSIEINSVDFPINTVTEVGTPVKATAVIDVKDPELVDSFGVEAVTITKNEKNEDVFNRVLPGKLVKKEGTKLTFEVSDKVEKSGSFRVALRLYPTNELLPNRMGFAYVRWF
ncbi:MAG: alpha-glucan family phosphorylase [Paludibacteraceae bacterium]|nr:alpha-glucan family phosphorylase [Paludibacteraceae bacterium]